MVYERRLRHTHHRLSFFDGMQCVGLFTIIRVGTGDFIMVLIPIRGMSFNAKGKVATLTRVLQLDAHSNNQRPLDH